MSTATYIDIHSHILPGIDDGAKTLKQSLAMAAAYVAAGVGHVFATPHHIVGTAWTLSADTLRQRVRDLQTALDEKNIPLVLYTGMEIALHRNLLAELERGTLLPLGKSNCYLLEPPFQPFQEHLLETLISFKKTGRDVILAHPERIPFFQKNPDRLVRLIAQGILLQVNMGSLLGDFGKKSQKTACYLAEHRAVHFVAADAHGPDVRKPSNYDEWQQLKQLIGVEQVRAIGATNASRLLLTS
jgi:protein-tyrosine phosphatase